MIFRINNQEALAKRALSLAQLQNNPLWRDPLTGWTKADAETVSEQVKAEAEAYKKSVAQIKEANSRALEDTMRRLIDTRDFNVHLSLLSLERSMLS